MKNLTLITLVFFMLTGNAQARQTHILHGLFCNTEAQAREALTYLGQNISLQAAVKMTNENSVACVIANKVQYMVVHPIFIDTMKQNGLSLTMYEATLVGVLVGENPRPVEPPVRTFLVLNELLKGATTQSGA